VAPDVWSHGSDATGAAEDVLVGVDQLHTLFPSRPSNGSGSDGYCVGREVRRRGEDRNEESEN